MTRNAPNEHLSDTELDQEYQDILNQLSFNQMRFLVARMDCKSDADAARLLGLDDKTPARWPEKKLIDRALTLAVRDGVVLALTMRRKVLPRAMAVKVNGLDSEDEKVKQSVATEIIEGELGKATQRQELTGKNGGAISINWEDGIELKND